jgi:hypothetical protein
LYDLLRLNRIWSNLIINEVGVGRNGRLFLLFFLVNNKSKQHELDADDQSIVNLRQAGVSKVEKLSYVTKRIRLTWIRAYDDLMSSGDMCLSYAQLINRASSLDVSAAEVDGFLRHFNNMGLIMWIGSDSQLRDFVILDPLKSFVEPVTRVICKHALNKVDSDFTTHHNAYHSFFFRVE